MVSLCNNNNITKTNVQPLNILPFFVPEQVNILHKVPLLTQDSLMP